MKLIVGSNDTVARLAGNEFAILQLDAQQPDGARALAAQIEEAFAAPFAVDGLSVGVGVSIGIAIAGGAMLWGGELTEFGRRACMIGLVVSVLVFAAPMLSSAFGVTAAVI